MTDRSIAPSFRARIAVGEEHKLSISFGVTAIQTVARANRIPLKKRPASVVALVTAALIYRAVQYKHPGFSKNSITIRKYHSWGISAIISVRETTLMWGNKFCSQGKITNFIERKWLKLLSNTNYSIKHQRRSICSTLSATYGTDFVELLPSTRSKSEDIGLASQSVHKKILYDLIEKKFYPKS